jgi:hypothetical protein
MKLNELAEIRGLFREAIRGNPTQFKEKAEASIKRGINKQYDFAMKVAVSQMDKWRSAVRDALSKQIPSTYLRKARPHSRRYPYRISGTLMDGVKTKVKGGGKSGGWAITLRAEIKALNTKGVDYADILERAANKRRDDKTPKWKGFIDRVLRKGDKQNNIKSVVEIFNEIKRRLG